MPAFWSRIPDIAMVSYTSHIPPKLHSTYPDKLSPVTKALVKWSVDSARTETGWLGAARLGLTVLRDLRPEGPKSPNRKCIGLLGWKL